MNFKNIKDKIADKINKQSIKGFLQKQGLYVLIFLCVVAAGITAIVAWPRDDVQQQAIESNQGVSANEDTTLEDELAALQTPEVSPSPSPSPTPEPTESTKPVTAQNGSGSMTLAKPVEGQIINEFSGNSLVFFPSLNMWATHNGVDIKGDNGAEVIAALSGTVEDAYTDESSGGVVVISHSGDSKTIYAGLGSIAVKKGDKINTKQKIGEIGEMPKELDLSYHLHFEYIVDGIWKDPEKYFK